jgi:hypothetical protein
LGDAGKVYKSTDSGGTWSLINGNTTTNSFGAGLGIYKDYLFVARSSNLDVYGPLSGSPAWTNGWKTLTATGLTSSTEFHPMLVGQDDTLYIGNEHKIASLTELTTFDPATSSTYTFNSSALDLPSDYRVRCLAELGTDLMIGTVRGGALTKNRSADIFPWKRSSTSFGLPIRLDNFGVHAMINVNNLLYIVAGIDGQVYVSNGTSTRQLRQIPNFLSGLDAGSYIQVYPGAIIHHKGRVHFAISQGTAALGNDIFGVWSVTPNGVLTFEHQISTGTVDFTNTATIGALAPSNSGTYLIGWQDNTSYGIDQTGTSSRYSSYTAYAQSRFYRVGTPLSKTQFTELNITFDTPLASGDGVKIKYRSDLSASFTTIATIDFATYGAITSYNVPFSHPALTDIQFQIELTQNARLTSIYVR